jgi:hypothetical protein
MRYFVKQFFATLLCGALFLCGPAATLAQTAATAAAPAVTSCPTGSKLVEGYTKKNGTVVAAHCKKSHGKKSSAMGAATSGTAAGTTSAGTAPAVAAPAVAAPAASAAAPDPAATTCPAGKTYVHSYTTKKGKTVAGYCRKAHKKASS